MFTELNLRDFFSAFVVLFAIIDIIGSIPIVINMRKKGKTRRKRFTFFAKKSIIGHIV